MGIEACALGELRFAALERRVSAVEAGIVLSEEDRKIPTNPEPIVVVEDPAPPTIDDANLIDVSMHVDPQEVTEAIDQLDRPARDRSARRRLPNVSGANRVVSVGILWYLGSYRRELACTKRALPRRVTW